MNLYNNHIEKVIVHAHGEEMSFKSWHDTVRKLENGLYNEDDFWIFYKVERMFQFNVINETQFKHLLALYMEKRRIERKINKMLVDISKPNGTCDNLLFSSLQSRIDNIDNELSCYDLLPECVQMKNLIDESIMNSAPQLKRKNRR